MVLHPHDRGKWIAVSRGLVFKGPEGVWLTGGFGCTLRTRGFEEDLKDRSPVCSGYYQWKFLLNPTHCLKSRLCNSRQLNQY